MKKTYGQTIARLRKEKKLTQPELAARMTARGSTTYASSISKWEKDTSAPPLHQFLTLCEVLEVKDILWEFAGIHSGVLSGFNEKGREQAKELLNLLFKIDEFRDEPSKLYAMPRQFRLYSIGVSAGTGSFLDESDYEMIEAPDYVPSDADFALRISGDSMEPLYRDKQVIWVKSQQVLRNGEIGVFFYDNNAYCKKYVEETEGAVLRSMNENYEDIQLEESNVFSVIGRVVA